MHILICKSMSCYCKISPSHHLCRGRRPALGKSAGPTLLILTLQLVMGGCTINLAGYFQLFLKIPLYRPPFPGRRAQQPRQRQRLLAHLKTAKNTFRRSPGLCAGSRWLTRDTPVCKEQRRNMPLQQPLHTSGCVDLRKGALLSEPTHASQKQGGVISIEHGNPVPDHGAALPTTFPT